MEPEIEESASRGVNLDYRLLLKWASKWKIVIGGVALLATLYGGITGYKEKPIYGAEASIMMVTFDSPSGLEGLLNRDTAGPLNMLKGVLESNTSRKMIAERAGIPFKDVQRKLTLLPDGLTKQIHIQARKHDTKTNLKLVQATLDVLDIRSAAVQVGLAGRQAANISKTLLDREAALKAAEDKLTAFSKTMVSGPDAPAVLAQLRQLELEYGAAEAALRSAEARARASLGNNVDVPSFLPGTEDLRKRIIEKRMELTMLQQSRGAGDPNVVRLKRELSAAEDLLNAEARKYLQSVDANVDPATAELFGKKVVLEWQLQEARRMAKLAPDEATNYQRLTREVQILNEVVTTLRTQYETAKIQADTEKLTWTVLDEPYQRDDRENPPSTKVVKFLFIGLAAGSFLAWILDMLTRPKRRK